MVNITEAAYSNLSEKLANRSDLVAARIILRDGRGVIRPGKRRQGDQVFQQGGRTLLLLSKDVAEHFDNRTLDVRKTDDGPKLRFRRDK